MREQYSIKEYIPRPISLKISEGEQQVRQILMQQLLTDSASCRIPSAIPESIVQTLHNKNILAVDRHQQLTAVYPVSALPTNKKVFLQDKREAWAMCAIDALGFHYAFNQPVRIVSECEYCKATIELVMHRGRVEVIQGGEDIYVLHTDLENQQNWSCSCCHIMHFFSCRKSLQLWVQENQDNPQKKFAVSLETANKIAWLLFSD